MYIFDRSENNPNEFKRSQIRILYLLQNDTNANYTNLFKFNLFFFKFAMSKKLFLPIMIGDIAIPRDIRAHGPWDSAEVHNSGYTRVFLITVSEWRYIIIRVP